MRQHTASIPRFVLQAFASFLTSLNVSPFDSLRSSQSSEALTLTLRHLSTSSFSDLAGPDLSNVAWCIAKGSGKSLYSKTTRRRLNRQEVKKVLSKTVLYSLIRLGHAPADVSPSARAVTDGPDFFTPSHLSRLMWAVAFCHVGDTVPPDHGSLARTALEVAGSRLDEFSCEELARVAWGYGRLGDVKDSSHISHTYATAGRVYAAVEGTLRRWEEVSAGEFTNIQRLALILPLVTLPLRDA